MPTKIYVEVCRTLIERAIGLVNNGMTHRQMCFEISDHFKNLYETLATIDPEQVARTTEHDLELLLIHLFNAANKAIIIFERCQDERVLGKIKNLAKATQIRDQLKAIKINLEVITGLISVVFHRANEVRKIFRHCKADNHRVLRFRMNKIQA